MKKLILLLLLIPSLVFSQTPTAIILSGQVPQKISMSINSIDYFMNPKGAFKETIGTFNIKSNSPNNIAIKISSNNNFNLISQNSKDSWSYSLTLVDSEGGEIVIDREIELVISKIRLQSFTLKASYPSSEDLNLFSDIYEDYVTIVLYSN